MKQLLLKRNVIFDKTSEEPTPPVTEQVLIVRLSRRAKVISLYSWKSLISMEDPPNIISIVTQNLSAFYYSKEIKININLTNLSKPINKNFVLNEYV